MVSLLFPLCIKVLWGSGDGSVTRVGLLLLVFAETGVVSSDIQNGCMACKDVVSECDMNERCVAEVPKFSDVTRLRCLTVGL